MGKITSRNFSILCDFMDVYQFMIDIYEKDWRNGVPAPFLEYALSSDWMDKSLVHRWKIWEDNGVIVGLVFYEHPIHDVYFSLRPGYEELADEMVAYADSSMPRVDGYLKFVIFGAQTAIKEAAALSEHYRRLKPLGATHMTGGGNPFYEKIGFQPLIHWTFWEKK